MGVSNIISLLSGIALFLFGMSLMGDGLKRVAGGKLEGLLYRLTSNSIKGVALGAGVTAVIQSSAATSVMVIGFVNAGMMGFHQAIGIVLGAILGTSATGWIICLSSISGGNGWISLLSTATLTGILSITGVLIRTFAKRATHRHVGDILIGLAILMLGMTTMSGAVDPLKTNQEFLKILTTFSSPIFGVMAGAILAAVLQSASAAVGILQAIAVTGSVTGAVALPMLLGIAIGSSVPVLMAGSGAGTGGKRTSITYLLITILGAIWISVPFYLCDAVFHFAFLDAAFNMFQIAALNTLCRFIMLVILVPQINLLDKIACKLIPSDPEDAEDEGQNAGPVFEERFIKYPALAQAQCQDSLAKMARLTRKSILTALDATHDYNAKLLEKTANLEKRIDRYEDSMGNYILKITKNELNSTQNRTFTRFLHMISDLERISDHALNIAEIGREINENRLQFSDSAQSELNTLQAALTEILNRVVDLIALGTSDSNDASARDKAKTLAETIDPLEEVIDRICEDMKRREVERMKSGSGSLTESIAFNDLITNCERVSDHCDNIALAVMEENSFQFHANRYHAEKFTQARFSRLYEKFRKQFALENASAKS